MDYISVKEAAAKFQLSERRVQKLCETHRINGCIMLSGIWLIPATAVKPYDERLTLTSDSLQFLSLKEVCEELSISYATGKNWIRLGKLIPEYFQKKTSFFSREYIETFKEQLQSGSNNALKSRRNKKYISGNALYNSYVSKKCQNMILLQRLFTMLAAENITLIPELIQLLVADCALHLFISKNKIALSEPQNLIQQFLKHNLSVDGYDDFINDLIVNPQEAVDFCKSYPFLFQLEYIYEENEDVLGLLYISCINLGNRKASGSYYTPTQTVKALIDKFHFNPNDKILDPCCGTGNFLLQLPSWLSFESIYGNDLDTISVKIARLNMALKYGSPASLIYDHITTLDYLTQYTKTGFDYIIGNPPWGYEFSDTERTTLKNKFRSASSKNIESYDVFIEQAFHHLSNGGHVAFVLPEAILNVKAHTIIRSILLEKCSIKNLDFLGNAFDGVQCPCIILNVQYTNVPLSTTGINVTTSNDAFTIHTERIVTAEQFSFTATDEEYAILQKIESLENAVFLSGNADFALGIVTGNNKTYISKQKTPSNEMVLRGADICKYHINKTENYITFKPENFQQIAPTEMYRAPEKLLYRFISSQLVFAYDNRQTLSLNSCNIVIPRLNGLNMKYVMAILNSRIAQFLYRKKFNSVKVLRSHIESIPIPFVSNNKQQQLVQLTDTLISGLPLKKAETVYDALDAIIAEIFNLTAEEYSIVKKAVDGENRFLA